MDADLLALRIKVTGGKAGAAEVSALNSEVAKSGAVAKSAASEQVAAQARLAKSATSLKSVGRGLTRYVSLPIAGIGVAAGYMALDFDRSMRNVNSIAQLPEKRFNSLKEQVLNLAGPTAQAPKTLAEGLYDLVSSGFDARESMVVLKSSALAASAGLTTTEISTKAVAASLNAYHLPASKAKLVSDQLFETVNRGVVTFPELATSIGDVLPFAAQLHVGLGEVGSAISTMTKEGLSSAEATTRYKNTLVTMLKPGKDLASTFKEMGTSGEDLVRKKGLQGALEAVLDTTDGTKEAVGKLFPNIRAMGGVLALTGINAKSAKEDLAGFRDVAGATNTVLKEQEKSFGFKLQRAWAELSKTLIELGETLLPVVVPFMLDLAHGAAAAASAFAGLPDPVQKVALGVAALVALAGPMLLFASAVLTAATNLGILQATEGGGIGLNKARLGRMGAGLAGGALFAAGQSGVGGKVGEAVGNIGGGAAVGFSVGGPWGAAAGAGLGALITAAPLIEGLFSSHHVDKLKAQTEHLGDAMKDYQRSLRGVRAGERLEEGTKRKLHVANQAETKAHSRLARVLAQFGVGSRQANRAQLALERAERGVTRAAKAEAHAHQLSGNRLQLYRVKSLHAVASIKQSIPTLRHRIRELNRENNAGKLSQKGLERLVHMEGRLQKAKTQLTAAYAKAESLAGKPWAHRLQSLTTLQAQYGRQGVTLKGQISGVRESMSNLKDQGLQTTSMYREQAQEVRKLIGLQERLIETAPHPGGNLGKPRHRMGHNASGTEWWRGGLSLVGERGPELLDLPRGSRVLSAPRSRAILGEPRAATAATRRGGGDTRYLVAQSIKIGRKVVAEAVTEAREDAEARL